MQKKRVRGFTLVELLMVVAIIGILAAIAIPNLMLAIQRAKQKKTMSNIRNIATAWEARASDFSQYNAAGGYAGANVTIPIADVLTLLSPTYIRTVPQNDGWGRPLDAYMDSAVASGQAATHYVLASPGRDNTYDTTQPMGPFTSFDCDIIYSNGAFMTYPANQ